MALAYERKKAKQEAIDNGQSTYSVGGRTYSSGFDTSGSYTPGTIDKGGTLLSKVSTSEPAVLSTVSGKQNFDSKVMPVINAANNAVQASNEVKNQNQATTDAKKQSTLEASLLTDNTNVTLEDQLYNAQLDLLETQKDQVKNYYKELTTAATKTANAKINNLTQQYDQRLEALQKVNVANLATWKQTFIRSGQSEYSPGMTSDFLSAKEREGQARVNELNTAYLSTVDEVNAALEEKKFSIAAEKANSLQNIDKQINEMVQTQIAEAKRVNQQINNQLAIVGSIEKGNVSAVDIFKDLNGSVSFDEITKITDTLPSSATEQYTLGRYDIRYDAQGNVIAKGLGAGGSVSTTNLGNATSTGTPIAAVGNPTISGLGTSYDTSTNDAQLQIDDIVNGLPTQLINNVAEIPRWRESVRKQLAAGYSPQEVIDKLSGFRIFDEANKPIGDVFYNLSQGTDLDPHDLAALVNRGAKEQAMTQVENAQLVNVKSFFSDTDKARATVKQSETVLNLLNDPTFPKDALGAFDAVKFKFSKKFLASLNTQETYKVQQLESALQLLAAPIRVEVAGTAATKEEMAKISAFQATINDQPEIIKTQVQELQNSVLRFHNEARSQRGLPTVDAIQLTDNKARLKMYEDIADINSTQAYANLSNTDFLSSFSEDGGIKNKQSSDADFWDSFNKSEVNIPSLNWNYAR